MADIHYTDSLEGITPESLRGFFVGWPSPPDPQTHFRILANSRHVWLACRADTHQVVGFVTAISDGVLSAYIPLLEVLPAYQKHGLGKMLVTKMLGTLARYYMVDLVCDPELASFYRRFNLKSGHAMVLQNYGAQSGVPQRTGAPL